MDEINSIIQSFSDNIARQRDQKIIDALSDKGYKFNNRKELEDFAKTRCHVVKHPNKLNQLIVDNDVVIEWWDTLEFNINGSNVTAIAGKKPDNT